jgi:predicted Zn-dependent protease
MQLSRVLYLAAALTASGSMSIYGQFHLGKDKDKDKSEVLREREQKREEKNLRTYDKIKTYSHEKYESDPDFRDQVNEGYRDVLRDHMAEARKNNVQRGSYILSVHEDRFRVHTGLYDNLLVQADINRLGQSLVPANSDRVFAFRLLPDPTPMARTLATGTIYISTGMVSLLDSEAQLAYVLAHEMAHVQLEHWKDLVMMQHGLEAYNVDQGKKAERVALLGAIAGAVAGGVGTKSGNGAITGGVAGGILGYAAGTLIDRPAVVEWDRAQEDEADKMAFKVLLDSRYDVREIPKLYATLESLSSRDQRMTLGFLGERNRVRERRENADKLIQQSYKAEIAAGMGKGFIGDTANHRNLMAEVMRDNGIMAYYSDMFEVARKNLGDAVAIRDNDPETEYFYGKTLETIGRSDDEHRLAVQCFQKAAQFDTQKQEFGSHLHYAIALMEDQKHLDSKRVSAELDNYVAAWFQYLPEERKAEFLPPSIRSIYDYMSLYSPIEWHPKLPAELQDLQVDFRSSPRRLEYAVTPVETTGGMKTSARPTAPQTPSAPRGLLTKPVADRR